MNKDFGTTTSTTSGGATAGDPITVLVAARKLIEKPENWCQASYANDAEGLGCTDIFDSRAVSFCASGAVSRVTRQFGEAGRDVYDILAAAMKADDVSQFNDTHTHPEVLAAFDRAIELAKQSQNPRSPVAKSQSNEEVVVP